MKGAMATSVRRARPVAVLALGAAGCLLALLVFELGLQIYAQLVLYPQLDSLLADRRHVLTKSEDPVLGYELAPGYRVESGGRELVINRYGLREESDDLFDGRRKLAILGDSVVMSFGHSQDATIDALLEASLRQAGDETVVLNFGVGGYGFTELLRFLEVKNDLYHADHVLYLLNPNDYTRRDTLYEGADNGTYRLYYRPLFKTRWFIGKAIYRYKKGGSSASTSVDWYRWLYEGNEQLGRQALEAMNAYCRSSRCGFSVVLLPAGVAYTDTGYALDDMYDEISGFLADRAIPHLSPVESFASDPKGYFDLTDHPTPEGNALIVRILHDFLAELGVVRERPDARPDQHVRSCEADRKVARAPAKSASPTPRSSAGGRLGTWTIAGTSALAITPLPASSMWTRRSAPRCRSGCGRRSSPP